MSSEEELAKVIRDVLAGLHEDDTFYADPSQWREEGVAVAAALLAAGYARRSDVVEECAKVADAVQFPEASKCLPTPRRGFELAQMKIVIAICALKGQP